MCMLHEHKSNSSVCAVCFEPLRLIRTSEVHVFSPHSWKQKCTDGELSSEELDELSLVDHNEIMGRITLKQKVTPC